ncbi:hypothetical protein LCGC14_2643350, partial [marine sediment metagenome]
MAGRQSPSPGFDHQPVNVDTILKNLGVLKKDPDDEVPLDKSAGDAFLDAMRDSDKVADCVTQLFPNGVPVDETFLDQLDNFHRWIGFADSGDEAIGLVWSEAMRRLSSTQQQELLEVFARQEGHDFFENSRSLYVVTRDHAFPAAFLSDWFVELLRAVERDVMQESVWKSIRTVCTNHVDVALETLGIYLDELNTHRCSIAGFMLGVLRSESLDEKQAAEFTRIENGFRENKDHSLRTVFNWSWVTTARNRALMQAELDLLLSRADESPEDLNNLVCVICQLIRVDCLPNELAQQCRKWVTETIGPTLSGEAKYLVVKAANHMYRGDDGAPPEEVNWIV